MIDALYVSPWPGVLVCTILFISDHSFTLACARMYQAGVRQHFVLEGSYELTPFHQRDIDALRRFSPRFWFALLLPWAALPLIWFVGNADSTSLPMYELALGAIVLLQLTVHVRHLRNYFLFRAMIAGEGIAGRIEYARRTILSQSAVELFAFAALYGTVFVLICISRRAASEPVFITSVQSSCHTERRRGADSAPPAVSLVHWRRTLSPRLATPTVQAPWSPINS